MKDLIYISVKEAMKELNVSRRTVYKYCQTGILIYSKPNGKRIYITKESVTNFLNNGLSDYNLTESPNIQEGGSPE